MNKIYPFSDRPTPTPPARLTQEQFEAKQTELLADLPKEFHSAIAYNAWEHGHSAGYEEVLIHVSDLADALAEPIKNYTKRIQG